MLGLYSKSHWAKEESWRYCYNSSRPNEQVVFAVEWLAQQHEATSWRTPEVAATTEATELSIPMWNKGNRKIVERMEEEKSCKFRVDPLVEQAAMAIQQKS